MLTRLQAVIARAEADRYVVTATGPAMLTGLLAAFKNVPVARPGLGGAAESVAWPIVPCVAPEKVVNAVAAAAHESLPCVPDDAAALFARELAVAAAARPPASAAHPADTSLGGSGAFLQSPCAAAAALARVVPRVDVASSWAPSSALGTAALALGGAAGGVTYGDTIFVVSHSAFYPVHWRSLPPQVAKLPTLAPLEESPLTRADSAEVLAKAFEAVAARRAMMRPGRFSSVDEAAYAPDALELIAADLTRVHASHAAASGTAPLLGSHAWHCTWATEEKGYNYKAGSYFTVPLSYRKAGYGGVVFLGASSQYGYIPASYGTPAAQPPAGDGNGHSTYGGYVTPIYDVSRSSDVGEAIVTALTAFFASQA